MTPGRHPLTLNIERMIEVGEGVYRYSGDIGYKGKTESLNPQLHPSIISPAVRGLGVMTPNPLTLSLLKIVELLLKIIVRVCS